MANNASYALGPLNNGPRLNSVAVTPGTTTYNPPLTKLFITTGGTLAITSPQTGSVTFMAPSNFVLDDVAILNVGSATTASGIIGFF